MYVGDEAGFPGGHQKNSRILGCQGISAVETAFSQPMMVSMFFVMVEHDTRQPFFVAGSLFLIPNVLLPILSSWLDVVLKPMETTCGER